MEEGSRSLGNITGVCVLKRKKFWNPKTNQIKQNKTEMKVRRRKKGMLKSLLFTLFINLSIRVLCQTSSDITLCL